MIWLRDQTKGQYVFGKREGIDSIEVREIPGKGGSRVYVQYLLAGVKSRGWRRVGAKTRGERNKMAAVFTHFRPALEMYTSE